MRARNLSTGTKYVAACYGRGGLLVRFDSSIVFVQCVISKCLPEMSVCYRILLNIN